LAKLNDLPREGSVRTLSFFPGGRGKLKAAYMSVLLVIIASVAILTVSSPAYGQGSSCVTMPNGQIQCGSFSLSQTCTTTPFGSVQCTYTTVNISAVCFFNGQSVPCGQVTCGVGGVQCPSISTVCTTNSFNGAVSCISAQCFLNGEPTPCGTITCSQNGVQCPSISSSEVSFNPSDSITVAVILVAVAVGYVIAKKRK
jgi:hypothetical protein